MSKDRRRTAPLLCSLSALLLAAATAGCGTHDTESASVAKPNVPVRQAKVAPGTRSFPPNMKLGSDGLPVRQN